MKKVFSAPVTDEVEPHRDEAQASRFARAYMAQSEEDEELGERLPASPFERPK
ncbi:MAG: hypothetical protein WAX57_03080 [Minisyncoccia bacterium]